MSLPAFYIENIITDNGVITLPEETAKHVIQVLRMKIGECILLTEGKGNLIQAEIINDHKKNAQVRIQSTIHQPSSATKVTIAISLLKNTSRFEWFLEKATEVGVGNIIPVICQRTERQHFRSDRWKNILVSAMLQSQQTWLPQLNEPLAFSHVVQQANTTQRFIAHCIHEDKRSITSAYNTNSDALILIGPEGDFTREEIIFALELGFIPVTLGNTRLRSETAGIVAAVLLKAGFK